MRIKTALPCDHFPPAGGSVERIQTVEVVVMAAMVPMGIDFWASRRSPERLEPAMIPEQAVRKKKSGRGEEGNETCHASVVKTVGGGEK